MGDETCEKRNDSLKHKSYELVPPDGGWGYAISVAATISFTTTTAFIGSFGILYNDFIVDTKMSSASVTILGGINFMTMALAGFFTSPLLKVMLRRKLALLASVIYSCGCFGTIIMKTPLVFFICFGIFQGVGLGLHLNLACTILNDYFLDKKVWIMNLVQAIVGLFSMVTPLFVQWSIDEFGVRGTLLLIAGISLHNFFSVSLMQPVEWHLKRIEIPEKEHLLNDEFEKADPANKSLENQKPKEKLLVPKLAKGHSKKSRIRTLFETFIDPSVCKTYVPSCASYGPAMCSVSDAIYVAMLPAYLYSIGWSQEHVAMSITLFGFGDLATRLLLTLISKWLQKVSIQEIYLVGISIAIVSRLGTFCTSSVKILMTCFTLWAWLTALS